MEEVAKRPKPSGNLLFSVLGGNLDRLEALHHGLAETPLKEFYPHLNLEELIVFEIASWELRSTHDSGLRNAVRSRDIYGIFDYIFGYGFPRVHRYEPTSKILKGRYARMNPFKGRNLRHRLQRVSLGVVNDLIDALKAPVNKYLFESDFEDFSRFTDMDATKMLGFQPKRYNRKHRESIAQRYAAEIARFISQYLGDYVPTPNQGQLFPVADRYSRRVPVHS
ncbi:hypothetical protein HYX02_03595 [Candidatus Woesearchaeota archaeon]|nr:hypothetical protein [Candidatus Woesearchaeota archaeon]